MKTFIISVIVVLIIIACGCILIRGSPRPNSYREYIVKRGDTLWGIAEKTDKYPITDIREVISEIIKVNNCDTTIYPGQRLFIPVYGT